MNKLQLGLRADLPFSSEHYCTQAEQQERPTSVNPSGILSWNYEKQTC
jgi:hypothetical protein